MPHSAVGRTLGHQLPVNCLCSIGVCCHAGSASVQNKKEGNDSAGYVKILGWYLYVPSRPCPLSQEEDGTASRPSALGPSGCSALCYMEFKKVSLALPQDLHLLMYL